MSKLNIVHKARIWEPVSEDPLGQQKKEFLEFMLSNCIGYAKALPIEKIRNQLNLDGISSRNSFQHNIVIPFRKSGDVFIGTGRNGLYLIESPEDAIVTTSFYTGRIRSEEKHLRHLRKIIKKHRLFKGIEGAASNLNHKIYFDESGTPSRNSMSNDPYFIVTAIIIPSDFKLKELIEQVKFIKHILHKPEDFEFKSTTLNRKEYFKALKQLSLLDFEFAMVCFLKENLTSPGFQFADSFFKYSYQFLIGNVLNYTGEVDLIFDEYGGKNSHFQDSFFNYIKEQNTGFPINKIRQMEMFSSSTEPLIQLADILGGALKFKLKNKFDLLPLIDDKLIKLEIFPPYGH